MKKRNSIDRLRELEAENIRLKAQNAKLTADLDYVAMMTDVEIGDEEEEDAQPEV
ncbi:MAG: hypothetical protein J5854_00095 [Clostridia bacterium]|nr:hypothetical protein [Clostridia bacterium]